ncbi:MAG: transglycosylase SLT domain-containing protein [Cytophagales bacterium]|nr:transglycosylase SLT domain-containing protein [Cytophagales bacterium]
MKNVFNGLLMYLILAAATAQPIEVPETIYFGGIKLNLSKRLRDDILKQIITITKNKTYFQAKIDKADTYFPIIEKVFEEEGIPTDFKYLAIQESSLNADAVSTSNAVGYWQFKKESAEEVGLTIDSDIDERKHIVEASKGAARYLMKNFQLTTNWIYALIAYNTGYGGAREFIDQKYIGANEMDIDHKLHWYAVTFLANKLAYEDKVGYNKNPANILLIYQKNNRGKSMKTISMQAGVDENKLIEYNKWALKKTIPQNQDYIVIIPVNSTNITSVCNTLNITPDLKFTLAKEGPVESQRQSTNISANDVPYLLRYNGLNAILAKNTDNIARLAFAGEVTIDKFRKYNDMQSFDEVEKGKIYYLETKNNKGLLLYHTVQKGESLREISQLHGIKLSQLIKKNRIAEGEAIAEGRLLYLRFNRPKNEQVIIALKPEIKPVPQPIIKHDSIKPVVKNNITSTIAGSNAPVVIQPTSAETKPTAYISDSTYIYHTVAPQQTLYTLSKYYGTKIDSIKAWNRVGDEGIKYDQTLIVSKSNKTLAKNYTIYKVIQPCSIDSLSQIIGVAKENILLWNEKKQSTVLTGELIKYRK